MHKTKKLLAHVLLDFAEYILANLNVDAPHFEVIRGIRLIKKFSVAKRKLKELYQNLPAIKLIVGSF